MTLKKATIFVLFAVSLLALAACDSTVELTPGATAALTPEAVISPTVESTAAPNGAETAAPNGAETTVPDGSETAVPNGDGTPAASGDLGYGYEEFLQELRATNTTTATVETGGEIEQPFFSVTGQIVEIDGSDVQVFEFESEEQRREVSDTISESGDLIGTFAPSWVDEPHFWTRGRLIVLYVGREPMVVDLLTAVLGEPLTTPQPSNTLPAEVVTHIRQWIGEQLDVAVDLIDIEAVERVEWPDACLGLPKPGEVCAQVITPGWRAVLRANDKVYEIRADTGGTIIRWREQES